jgi:hypothetical protein
MKGVVFNLLEEVVRAEFGEAMWDRLLDEAGLEGAYTSLGSYPDEDLRRLVAAASDATGMSGGDVVRWFGREAMPHFAARYPEFFSGHRSTRDFVLTLNDIIHPEVRKLYPGAFVPDFLFDTSDPNALGMTYTSPRHMCTFAEGLIEGAAPIYGEEVRIVQTECMHRGDPRCVFEITFHDES